jgi:hypothetical protein
MNRVRTAVTAAAVAGSMLIGGVAGAALYGVSALNAAAASNAASPTPTPPAAPATSSGKFVPNEDPTHEAGESAAREAQENAGQVPTVP